MRRRFLNLTLALGLVTGLLVGAIGTASAETPVGSENEWIFFPWVPNGEFLNGDVANVNGPWHGTVTVQNLEDFRIWIDFGQTAGGGFFQYGTTLEAHASKTFSAAQLGIPEPGAAVVVRSRWYLDANAGVYPDFCDDTFTITQEIRRGTGATSPPGGADPLPSSNVGAVQEVSQGDVVFVEGRDYFYNPATNSIDWSPDGLEPLANTLYTVVYTVVDCGRGPEIGGVQKQVMATPSLSGQTNSSHISVDGYTAIPDEDVPWGPASFFCHDVFLTDCNALGGSILGIPIFGSFDGHSYLPIAQNNWNGWNSTLHISNVDASSPAFTAVTVTLYAAGGQGVSGPSIVLPPILVGRGETETIDLADVVGNQAGVWSVWITSDYGVVSNINRYKAQTRMLLTNQSAPSLLATTSVNAPGQIGPDQVGLLFEMHAPLIFKDYNGWNTGINIANISEFTNTVSVTFYGPTGNVVGADSVSIPPKAMEYIYMPAQQDLGLNVGFVGAATLSSALPFHAAVDEVKYTVAGNTGQDQGQAMSYIATAAGASCDAFENFQCFDNFNDDFWDTLSPAGSVPRLSVPLLQKGNTQTGLGDTSGINLYNADANSSVTAWVQFYHPSGALAAPTVAFPFLEITLGPLNSATLYTHNYSEMSQGFQGSAQIVPVSGSGNLFGVSNNVNYAVGYDGSAVYNLLNTWGQYRLFCSQTNGVIPCVYQGGGLPAVGVGE